MRWRTRAILFRWEPWSRMLKCFRDLPGLGKVVRAVGISILLLSPFISVGCRSALEPSLKAKPPDMGRIHPAPGTSMVRFEELDDGVYRGSKPKSDADYE